MLMRIGGSTVEEVTSVLLALTRHSSHHLWPDAPPHWQVQWQAVKGHRQVTDTNLATLARVHGGKLATSDRGLVALHADMAIAVMN